MSESKVICGNDNHKGPFFICTQKKSYQMINVNILETQRLSIPLMMEAQGGVASGTTRGKKSLSVLSCILDQLSSPKIITISATSWCYYRSHAIYSCYLCTCYMMKMMRRCWTRWRSDSCCEPGRQDGENERDAVSSCTHTRIIATMQPPVSPWGPPLANVCLVFLLLLLLS